MFSKLRSEKNLNLLVLFILTSIATLGYFSYYKISYTNFFTQDLLAQSFGIWMLFLVASMFISLISSVLLQNYVSELYSHQVSALALTSITVGMIIPFIQTNHPSMIDAISIGVFWSLSYLVYEYIYYSFVQEEGVKRMMSDYNVFEGRLLGVITLTQALVPPAITLLQ